jgi:hypothetical protein
MSCGFQGAGVGSSHRSEQRDDNHQPNDTMNATYNDDTQLLSNYRKHRASNNPTGMGAVYLYNDGSITTGASVIARFFDKKTAAKSLKDAGFRKGDSDKHCVTYYI